MSDRRGSVFLVGAGPGAFDLITLRGADCLRQADCVVYDALVNPDLLQLAPSQAELIFAGKRRDGGASIAQAELNALLVERARKGKRVVRLKGGDPFIFGRGGEEADALARAGVHFEVVPGTGQLYTRDAFGDCQLHIEFAAPSPAHGEDQDRGNSGVFLHSLYEIQVLSLIHI